ncbi:hypothetical protein [Streptomyces sp. NPDC090057]|uniref:hypothetical protein n=1 Tax=Streptomyces sp. NPDC090057 TaxID=3365935 RepID=UPI00381DC333
MPANSNPVIAALPGGGWKAICGSGTGFDSQLPIVGWLVYADGTCRPFTFDWSGNQHDPTTRPDFRSLQEPIR